MSDNLNTTELRRLYDAATPGTWDVVDGIIGRTIIVKSHFLFELLRECTDEDAEFIAAAHNSIPALLYLLEAYRSAMRRAIVNAGGIAEEGVSDKFLLENVPAEMALLHRQVRAFQEEDKANIVKLDALLALAKEFKAEVGL